MTNSKKCLYSVYFRLTQSWFRVFLTNRKGQKVPLRRLYPVSTLINRKFGLTQNVPVNPNSKNGLHGTLFPVNCYTFPVNPKIYFSG